MSTPLREVRKLGEGGLGLSHLDLDGRFANSGRLYVVNGNCRDGSEKHGVRGYAVFVQSYLSWFSQVLLKLLFHFVVCSLDKYIFRKELGYENMFGKETCMAGRLRISKVVR